MKVVSIVNQKGGVGKTTTCANLSACLALKGLRTLVIDLDPQANLTLGLLRGEWAALPYGLYAVLNHPETAPLAGIVRQVAEPPLYLAPGHMEMARCEVELASIPGAANHLRKALQALDRTYPMDWVLLDCPPSLGMLTQNAIVASDYLIIPTEAKFYSFAGMATLNKMIAALAREYDFEANLLGILLTMYDSGPRLHRTIAEEIRTRFGPQMFDTVIRRNIRIAEAEVEGRPIILFDRKARGAQNYNALADEILKRTNK